MNRPGDPQPQQLRALYEAGLVVADDIALDAVLQRVVDLARELAGATYGALGIFGSQNQIEQFITSGMTAAERTQLGPLPKGRGLLAEMLKAAGPLRFSNIASHPASVGFPRRHPQMTSFLGIPILYHGRTLGILYLTDKRGAPEFSEEDAQLLELFAAQAAAAVENARLLFQAEQQSLKLQELHRAGLLLSSDLSVDAVLQQVVDLAREMTDATYGALGVLGGGGRLEQFITSGLSQQERQHIGDLPTGKGLLGEMLHGSQPLRVKNMAEHLASVGFPDKHPPMTSFLGVPVIHRGQLLGSIYLTDKRGADEFDEADSSMVVLFAGQAALAIENARLLARIQQQAVEEERHRLAGEMHDGLAQVLGYVNVKTGEVEKLLADGRLEEASTALGQLAGAARDVYADVREDVLGLRALSRPGGDLVAAVEAYIEQFQFQSGITVDLIVELEQAPWVGAPVAELQLIRLVQESLSNVRKHSGASHALVRLMAEGDHALLRIEDNGSGFRPEPESPALGPHFGLQIMKERAESLGGSFEIQSAAGKGTTVLVRIPKHQHINP